jgi:hypothetical protein
MTPPLRNLPNLSAKPLLDGEHKHMNYFQVVCAKEFSLFFEHPVWENMILQGTITEPTLHHAALAIGSLASSRYYPQTLQRAPAIAFSIRHYSMAIQNLHFRLDKSSQSLELAILASIVFSYIEFLLELDSRLEMHIRAGCAMLESLHTKQNGISAVSIRNGLHYQVSNSPASYNLFASAMLQLTSQVNRVMAFQSSSDHGNRVSSE